MAKLSNSPKQALNFDLERRKSFTFRVRLKYSDGSLVNLTGCTLRFVMKSAGAVDDHFDLNNLVVNSEATIGAPHTGEGVFAFQAAELDGDPGEYSYTIVLWSPDNFSTVLAKGVINLLDNSESHSMHRLYSATAPTSALELTLRGGDVVEVEVVSLPQVPVSVDAISWPDVGDKPESFPPSTHGHTINEVTGLAIELAGKQPAGNYAASVHQHTVSDVTGLQGALDGKSPTSHNHDGTYAPATHGHTIAQVTGLQGALDGKAASSHSHTIAQVTGLQGALDGKQPAGSYAASTHTHTASNITDFTEATQDIVGSMVTGAGGTYNDAAGTITLPSGGGGGGAVSSVAGRTGDVALSSADLTDVASPATDAELTAGLAGKANATHTHSISGVTGLQTALDGKATSGHTHSELHTHANKTALDAVSGTNTGDQDLSGYLTTSAAPELIRDTMGAALVAGANVTITPNDAGDSITIAASGGGGGVDAEQVQDIVGAMVTGAGGSYDDAAGTITLPSGGGSGISLAPSVPAEVGEYFPVFAYNGAHQNFQLISGRILPCPVLVETAGNTDAVSLRVDAGAAGVTVELALYSWGRTASHVATLGTVDVSSSGLKTLTFAPRALAAGKHVVVARPIGGNVTLWGFTGGAMALQFGPSGGSNAYGFPHVSGGSMPASITWDYNAGRFGTTFPKLMLRRSA